MSYLNLSHEDLRCTRSRRRADLKLDFSFLKESAPLFVQLQSAQSLSRTSHPTKSTPLRIPPLHGSVLSVTRKKSLKRGMTLKPTSQIVDGKFVPLRTGLVLNRNSTSPLRVNLPVVRVESTATVSTLTTLQKAQQAARLRTNKSSHRTSRRSAENQAGFSICRPADISTAF